VSALTLVNNEPSTKGYPVDEMQTPFVHLNWNDRVNPDDGGYIYGHLSNPNTHPQAANLKWQIDFGADKCQGDKIPKGVRKNDYNKEEMLQGISGIAIKSLVFDTEIELTQNNYFPVEYNYAKKLPILMGRNLLYHKKWTISKPAPNSRGQLSKTKLAQQWWVTEDL